MVGATCDLTENPNSNPDKNPVGSRHRKRYDYATLLKPYTTGNCAPSYSFYLLLQIIHLRLIQLIFILHPTLLLQSQLSHL
jgi:hypothetical protein